MSEESKRRHIGQNVRRLRSEAGLTQAELAERADIADATLSRIERNRLVPSVELASRLASALGVGLDALLARAAAPSKRRLRRGEARLLGLVRDLDDAQVDDVARAVKLLLAAGRRFAKSSRS